MAKWLVAVALASLLAQDDQGGNSYKGKAPPELVNVKAKWLNTAAPLTLEGLRGKPVWVEFGFLKCGPCRKMKPTLARWHKDYAGKGLVIIDVSDGSLDELEALQKEVEEKGEKFAVLWDADGRICMSYGIEAYPRAYLVGVDGKVLWEGIPNSKIDEIEKLIIAEIAKVK